MTEKQSRVFGASRHTRAINVLPPALLAVQAAGVTNLSQEELEEKATHMAILARRVYYLCAREFRGDNNYGRTHVHQWDGGCDAWGRQCQPIWPKVAAQILRIGAEPLEYIRAQFWAHDTVNKPVTPNHLITSEAVTRYQKYRPQGIAYLRRMLVTETRSIRGRARVLMTTSRWELKKALDYAVLDPASTQASALSRYCVAVKEELEDAAQRLREAALLQYAWQQPAFDAAWGDIIPEELRTEARGLREQVMLAR